VSMLSSTVADDAYAHWGRGKAVGCGRFMFVIYKLVGAMEYVGGVTADFLGLTQLHYQFVADAKERYERKT